jgi:prepilin-type N-terminal cleavage/methylation domain-containing protein
MKRAALQFGFTIVELLVTIVVVGILASIVTVTYNGTQAQSRDKQRVTDMEIIVNALEKYKSQHGEYPEEQSMPSNLDGSGWELSNRPAGFLSELKNSGTLKDVPIEANAKNVGGSPSRDSSKIGRASCRERV